MQKYTLFFLKLEFVPLFTYLSNSVVITYLRYEFTQLSSASSLNLWRFMCIKRKRKEKKRKERKGTTENVEENVALEENQLTFEL